jgi:hypothetical protein
VKAIVVYESHWGNTAAVARAVAEGIGPDARALTTAEADVAAVAGADLIVAGAPLLGFSLPTDVMIKSLNNGSHPVAPDLSHPGMRSWLAGLPEGSGYGAGFETRVWWSPGSAAKTISRGLELKGWRPLAKPQRFIVSDRYGPLRDGELERAKAWGAELAKSLK